MSFVLLKMPVRGALINLRCTTAILAGVMMFNPVSVAAQDADLTWRFTTINGGNWNRTATRWLDGGSTTDFNTANGNPDNATFEAPDPASGYTVTVDEEDLRVRDITFNADDVRVDSSGDGSIRLWDNPTITVTDANHTATIAVPIDTGNINKAGDGLLRLTGVSATDGTVDINAGRINLEGGGQLTGGGKVTIASGATLGGSGTIAGNVENDGVLRGRLTIEGDVNSNDAGSEFNMTTDAVIEGEAQLGGTSIASGVVFQGGLRNQGTLDFQADTTGGDTFNNTSGGFVTNTNGLDLTVSGFDTFIGRGSITTHDGAGNGSLTIEADLIQLYTTSVFDATDSALNLTGQVEINADLVYTNLGTITGDVTVESTASFDNADQIVTGTVTSASDFALAGGSVGGIAMDGATGTITGGTVTGNVSAGAGANDGGAIIISEDVNIGSMTIGGGDDDATGQITNNSTTTVAGGVVVQGDGLADTGLLTVDDGSTLNAATVAIDEFATLQNQGTVAAAVSSTGGAIFNDGTITGTVDLNGDDAALNAESGSSISGVVTNTNGRINADGGSFGALVDNQDEMFITDNTTGTTVQNNGGALSVAGGVTLDADLAQISGGQTTMDGTLDGSATVSGGTLDLNGDVTGNIAMSGAGRVDAEDVTVTGGITTAGTADLNIAGTVVANVISNGGTTDVTGILDGTAEVQNGVLTNTGTINGAVTNTSPAGVIRANGGVFGTGEIVNDAGTLQVNATYADLDVQANGGQVNINTGNTLTGTFTQDGATTNVDGTLDAAVLVDDGTVNLNSGGTVTGLITNQGGIVNANGGTFTVGTVLNTVGELNFTDDTTVDAFNTGGDVTLDDTVILTGNLFSQGGTSVLGDGEVTGNVTVAGGDMNSEADIGGNLDVSNGGTFVGDGGALTGTAVNDGGTLEANGMTFAAAAVIDNQSGTTRIRVNTDVDITNVSDTSEIAISEGADLTGNVTNTDGDFFNRGTVSGNITLDGGFFQNYGTVEGTIDANGGVMNMRDGDIEGLVTSDGTEINARDGSFSGGVQLNAGGEFDVRQIVTASQITNDGGDIIVRDGGDLTTTITNTSGDITNFDMLNADVTMADGLFTTTGATNGLVTLNGGQVDADTGSTFDTEVLMSGGTFRIIGDTTADLNNTSGFIRLNAGGQLTGDIDMSGGDANNNDDIIGVVDLSGGTFNQLTGADTSGLTTVTGGTLVGDGGAFSGGILTQLAATLTLTGDTAAEIENDGATIDLAAGVTVTGDVTNTDGIMTMRSDVVGTVDVADGMVTFGGASSVSELASQNGGMVELAGGDFTTGFDANAGTTDMTGDVAGRLRVEGGDVIIRGAATLDGRLNVNSGDADLRGTVDERVLVRDGTLVNSGTITGKLVMRSTADVTHEAGGNVIGTTIVGGGTLEADGGSFDGQVRVDGGAVNINADTTANGNVNVLSGDLLVANGAALTGNVKNAGTFLLDGTLNGNLNNLGTTDIDSGTAELNGTLTNTGTLLLDGQSASFGRIANSGRLGAPVGGGYNLLTLTGPTLEVNGLIENLAGAMLDVAGANLAGETIESAGEIAISDGKVLLSKGSIDLFSGSVTTIKDGGMEGETITAAAGSSIEVQSGDIEANVAFTSAGDVLSRGTSSIIGDLSLTGSGTLEVRGNRLDIDGTFDAGGNTEITIASGATLRTNDMTFGGEMTMADGTGIRGGLRNTGIIRGAGELTFGGGLRNAGGTVNVSGNGSTDDRINVDGGIDGGTFRLDIDLGRADGVSDQIVLSSGAMTGDVTLAFNLLDEGARQDNPVVVIDANGNATDGATYNVTGLPEDDGPIVYTDTTLGNGDVVITEGLNPAISGLAGSVVLTQSLIGSVINRPSSPFVSGLALEGEDPCGAGMWARATGGYADSRGSTVDSTLGDQNFQSELELTYGGVQVGGDWACFGGFYNGWDMAFGGIAGVNLGAAEQPVFGLDGNSETGFSDELKSVTDFKFTQGYAGIYGTAVKGPLAVDLQYRVEQTSFTANNEAVDAGGAGLGLTDAEFNSDAQTLSGAVSYAIPLDEYDLTFVPTAGFAFTQVSTDTINFDGTGTLEVQDFENQVGFVGGTLARTRFGEDGVSAINQFVTATIYNDFAENPVSIFTPDDGSGARSLTTENLGTYGELSAGLNYVRILQPGEFGAVRQFNAAVRADVRYSDQLESWGVTAQARFQF